MATTEECINAISKQFYESGTSNYDLLKKSNWVPFPIVDINENIERVFHNEVADEKVKLIFDDDNSVLFISKYYPTTSRPSAVVSRPTEVEVTAVAAPLSMGSLHISSVRNQLDPSIQPISSIKRYLRDKLRVEAGDEISDLHYVAFGPENVVGWPMTDIPPDADAQTMADYANDPQDMENFEWVSIDDEEINISCGGDWQNPMSIKIKLVDGFLTVVDKESGTFMDGITEDELIEAINN